MTINEDLAVTTRANALVNELVEAVEVLQGFPSLDPAPDVDEVFTRLVRLTLYQDAATVAAVLSDPRVQERRTELYRLCSKRVCGRERVNARQVLEGPESETWDRFSRAPYFANYERLTRLEANALFAVAPRHVSRVLFAGSGPLPTSAILMARAHDLQIECVEIDPVACELSREIVRRLGLDGRIRVVQADVQGMAAGESHDAVFLAGLVGITPTEKAAVLGNLAKVAPKDATLAIRSAQGLKALLFPEVALDSIPGFAPVIEIHPHNGIINSLLLFQRRETLFDDVDARPK